MVGKHNGVVKKLGEQVPHLISNHCLALRLALAFSQSAKDIPYLKTFKDILDQLNRFYKYSPVRTATSTALYALPQVQPSTHCHKYSPLRTAALHQPQALYDEKTLKFTQAKDVRWLSHDLATSTLKKCLPAVISSLEREAQERNDAQAMGLSVFVQYYKFLAALMMVCDILPHMSALSKAMQVFDKFLTNLETNFEGRFPDLPLIESYAIFDTTNLPDVECERQSYGTEEITNSTVHFSLNPETTLTEWLQVKDAALHKKPMNADRTMEWIPRDLAESHPNVQTLVVAGLLISTSTADCELGFVTLKSVKTTHRSVMSNRVLLAIAM